MQRLHVPDRGKAAPLAPRKKTAGLRSSGRRTHWWERTMSEPAVKQIVLASRPKGLPTRENFRLEEVPMPGRGAAYWCACSTCRLILICAAAG
jgi:hypothetical protein